MRGDPYTGRVFHYGSWVWRVESGGEGTSQAHEVAGRGVPSPGNTAEAEGQNHPDMEFEEFAIPDDQPAGDTGGSQANPTRTFPVHQETVEILDEDEPQDNRSMGKEKEKTGCRTKKVGEIGPITADRLGMDSPTEVARLKKKNEELALLLKSQTDELAKLSKMAGSLGAENTRVKEENDRLLDEVSETKREMAEKEENFPGRAAAWVEENKAEAARVLTASPEATMESFRLLYREPEGKKMITAVGSFGFKCGQKKDQAASHRILLKRDPSFTAASYGLAPSPEEEPTPPFPLD
ncbi:unnamed protein product [Cuscuta campestris]|uniref:Uncharacterized protein n=1 Tax=Cuscuta campestris TaxID=132261 RepID=A0A484KL07_9ASTE|nr:unnamed protein product [Cuscuta campestris]